LDTVRQPPVNQKFDISRLPWWQVVTVGSLVAVAWTMVTPSLPDTELLGLFKQSLNLGLELNLSVWWSSMLFFSGAALAVRLARTVGEDRVGWAAMAAVLAVLSLDELGSIHERASDSWGLPGMALVVALAGLSMFRLARHGRGRSAALFGASLALLAIASQVLEEVDTLGSGAVVGAVRGIEEGTELLGACLILLGLVMALAEPRSMTLREFLPRLHDRSSRVLLLALLAVGLVVALAYVPEDGRGDPGRWFAAIGFLVVAGTLQWDRSVGGRPGLASLVAVAASIDVCYHLYDVPGAERVIPDSAQHISGWLIALALCLLAHDRLRPALWKVPALCLPVLGIVVLPLSDSHQLHHTLAVCTALVWVAGIWIRPALRTDSPPGKASATAPLASGSTTDVASTDVATPELAKTFVEDSPPRSRRPFGWVIRF
jgi:hypothetical protein